MTNNLTTPQSPKAFFKTLTIIYAALLIGQALFGVVAFSIALRPAINLEPGNDVYFYLVPLFVITTGFIGTTIYSKRVAELRNAATLKEKAAGYQTALIIRYALSEGATLFAIVVFLLDDNIYYLIIAGLNILYFLLLRPTIQKMGNDVNLTYDEKLEF